MTDQPPPEPTADQSSGNEVMYYAGYCPKCGQGLLGIRSCGGTEPHYSVLCDECDALWDTPDFTVPVLYPDQPKLPCPDCESSLCGGTSHWASLEEIERVGWVDHIAGKYLLSEERPKSNTPSEPFGE